MTELRITVEAIRIQFVGCICVHGNRLNHDSKSKTIRQLHSETLMADWPQVPLRRG